MDYIEAPNNYGSAPRPLVFLAGGITGCPDWQQELRGYLELYSWGTMLNPRRADFPIGDPAAAREQITWEFHALRSVEIVSFWFAKKGAQPIVMYELGMHLTRVVIHKGSPLCCVLIGIEPGFPRTQDVVIQAELATSQQPAIQESLIAQAVVIKAAIQRYRTRDPRGGGATR